MKCYDILLLVVMCATSNCINSKNCNSGTISLGSYLKKTASTQQNNDLPSEFSYTIKEFTDLIRGKWLSENGDSYLELEIDTSKEASFNVAVSGALCGPTCCEINILVLYKTNSLEDKLSGTVTAYSKVDSGEVKLTSVNKYYYMNFKKNQNNFYIMVGNFGDLSASVFVKGPK